MFLLQTLANFPFVVSHSQMIVFHVTCSREPFLRSLFVVRFTDSTLLVSSKLSSPLSLDVYTSQSLATGGHKAFYI
jgi:hypothetical protein